MRLPGYHNPFMGHQLEHCSISKATFKIDHE